MISRLVRNPEMAKELGLSDEQITALRDGIDGLRREQIDLQAELEKAAMNQARVMTAATIDEEAALAAVEKTGQIRTEIARVTVRQLLLVKKTLTTEQLAKIKERMQARMRQRGQRGEGRDRGGNGMRNAGEQRGKRRHGGNRGGGNAQPLRQEEEGVADELED